MNKGRMAIVIAIAIAGLVLDGWMGMLLYVLSFGLVLFVVQAAIDLTRDISRAFQPREEIHLHQHLPVEEPEPQPVENWPAVIAGNYTRKS